MNVKIKTFVIPAFDSQQSEEQLNAFLSSHRVLQTERHFCPEKNGYWAFLVEYMDGDPYTAKPVYRNEKKDVTADLDEPSLSRFNIYKDKRLEISKERALPAYAVFKDKELAEMAKLPLLNEQTAKGLKNISPQRLNDYVSFFFNLADGEKGGQPDAQNSGNGQPA